MTTYISISVTRAPKISPFSKISEYGTLLTRVFIWDIHFLDFFINYNCFNVWVCKGKRERERMFCVACMYVWYDMCLGACMTCRSWRSASDKCLSWSQGVWVITDLSVSTRLAGQSSREPPRVGIEVVYLWTWLFTWILRMQTRALMLSQQALHSLSNF